MGFRQIPEQKLAAYKQLGDILRHGQDKCRAPTDSERLAEINRKLDLIVRHLGIGE